jgi:hypothetical protein
LVKTFKSGNEAKAWVMKSPGGHSIMTKKQWDVSEGTSVNEASKKPTIKVVNKLKNEEGIQIVVTKTTKGETMYGGFVVRGKLQKVIPVGANNSKEGVQKRALQIWDEFGKQLGESVNEAGDDRFDWPPVLDKFKGKEIDKLEADYKASLAKSSAILDKQRQLIRTTLGNKFEFPWENYDKWPAKLKAEVQKLNSQIDKEREKHPAMFKKLMQARGTWR